MTAIFSSFLYLQYFSYIIRVATRHYHLFSFAKKIKKNSVDPRIICTKYNYVDGTTNFTMDVIDDQFFIRFSCMTQNHNSSVDSVGEFTCYFCTYLFSHRSINILRIVDNTSKSHPETQRIIFFLYTLSHYYYYYFSRINSLI